MCNLITIITNPFLSLYVRSLVITLVISRVEIDESISDEKGKRKWSDRVTSSFLPAYSQCYTHVIPFVHGNSSTERILLREITNFLIVYCAKGNQSFARGSNLSVSGRNSNVYNIHRLAPFGRINVVR